MGQRVDLKVELKAPIISVTPYASVSQEMSKFFFLNFVNQTQGPESPFRCFGGHRR